MNLGKMLPDFALRRIIRYQLSSLLKPMYARDHEEQLQIFVEYVKNRKEMPISTSSEAVRDIYEVPAEAAKLILGKYLKLSSLYFKRTSFSLDEAEAAMLQLTCERGQVQNGQRVLDVGGGYGALSLYIAEKFPLCQITTVSYSECQKEFIEEQCKKRGLKNVKAVNADIANFETSESFDRIFAIEIFENYQLLFKKLSLFMKSDGLLFVELGCHRLFSYDGIILGETESVLSENILLYFQDDVTVVHQWRVNGKHQAKACETWVRNIDKNYSNLFSILSRMYGENKAAQRMADLRDYFFENSVMLGYNNGHEWFISHQLFQKK